MRSLEQFAAHAGDGGGLIGPGFPINYSLALEEHGIATAHRHVGRETSGRGLK